MSRYRETMTDLYRQVQENAGDYLRSKMTDTQINNIKKTWSMKTAKDVTPAIRDMIKKMDIPTQLAIKHAKINQLSKLVEDLEENFSPSQIARLKKEYEVLRGKKISVANANKLSQMFKNIPDSGLKDIFKADIPFLSVMAMTKMIQKGIPRPAGVKLNLEEVEILDEALHEIVDITEGMIDSKKFDSLKKGDTMTISYKSAMGNNVTGKKFKVKSKSRSAKYNTDKVTLHPDGNPSMARFFLYKRADGSVSMATGDMAVSMTNFKEEIDEGRMSDIDAMRKRGASAAEIAKELKLDVKAVKAILGEELAEEEDAEKLKAELKDKDQEIAQLKQKAETDKAKTAKKETEKLVNPETGEPLLQVGIAYKHLKDKMAKEKSAEEDRKEKKAADMKDKVAKIKDKLKENFINESDASDKAKMLGLTYMKFGRYGKDGKVTHISKGGQLVKSTGDKDVDDVNKSLAQKRADDKAKEPKKEPEPKPQIDKFDAQKDLESKVTDGMIDVEDDGDGGLSMNKEYEPSQDYDVENDAIAIKDYLLDKGIDEDDIYIDVEGGEEDEYLQLNVQVRGKKVEEMKKDDAYAIGMAQAKKVMNDEPPLQKKTIKKGHEIADKILNKDEGFASDAQRKAAFANGYKEKGKDKKEETIKEFKKMTVTFKDMADMSKASTDLAKKGFTINAKGLQMKVDGKGADLNKYATDLQNFYKATVVAEETIVEFTSQQIKMAYGVANDKRYKGGNYSGAVKAIEKIAKGLSNHPDVMKVLQRTNENVSEAKLPVGASLRGQHIANKMMRSKTMKSFAPKVAKMARVTLGDLEDMLPDYISGADISKLFNESPMMSMNKQSPEYKQGQQAAKQGKKYLDNPHSDAQKKLNWSAGHNAYRALNMAKEMYESLAALKKKADKSGMPYSILKKVFDRGMAAWKGGHRPGASQHQWAYARVNSFVTKSSGTWGGADKDLAAKVKGE